MELAPIFLRVQEKRSSQSTKDNKSPGTEKENGRTGRVGLCSLLSSRCSFEQHQHEGKKLQPSRLLLHSPIPDRCNPSLGASSCSASSSCPTPRPPSPPPPRLCSFPSSPSPAAALPCPAWAPPPALAGRCCPARPPPPWPTVISKQLN